MDRHSRVTARTRMLQGSALAVALALSFSFFTLPALAQKACPAEIGIGVIAPVTGSKAEQGAVEAFQSLDDYYRSLENLLGEITSGPTAPDTDTILIPGQGSARRGKKSRDNGLQIPDELWSDVVSLARDLGVQHPLIG